MLSTSLKSPQSAKKCVFAPFIVKYSSPALTAADSRRCSAALVLASVFQTEQTQSSASSGIKDDSNLIPKANAWKQAWGCRLLPQRPVCDVCDRLHTTHPKIQMTSETYGFSQGCVFMSNCSVNIPVKYQNPLSSWYFCCLSAFWSSYDSHLFIFF